jgi:hypothetical protein
MVNAAALLGLIKFLGGKRQAVWDKAESTRTQMTVVPDNGATTVATGQAIDDPKDKTGQVRVFKN